MRTSASSPWDPCTTLEGSCRVPPPQPTCFLVQHMVGEQGPPQLSPFSITASLGALFCFLFIVYSRDWGAGKCAITPPLNILCDLGLDLPGRCSCQGLWGVSEVWEMHVQILTYPLSHYVSPWWRCFLRRVQGRQIWFQVSFPSVTLLHFTRTSMANPSLNLVLKKNFFCCNFYVFCCLRVKPVLYNWFIFFFLS